MSVTDIIAVLLIVGIIVMAFGGKLWTWIKSLGTTSTTTNESTSPDMSIMTNRLSYWLTLRGCKQVKDSREAVEAMEIVKNAIIKYEDDGTTTIVATTSENLNKLVAEAVDKILTEKTPL